ncbi:MAG: DJ-1/PfpI family protein [Hydrogenophaga sp.]|uniref:DJ-1/PfpI family protein n=1 Tax=Hydrogenophaga sp. TaxID=1904254 RepID=UPI00271C152C|nr:DJ-1/PfpI family protein [Hydrogenophaga sp.]MDO9571854.1 DJ-1/PfpI family protein [Hydrogenophaga sp.]
MSTTATVSPTPTASASPAPVFTIALLAFDDMEALDFAGPFEVFTTASRVFARMLASQNAADCSSTESTRPLFGVTCVARTLAPVQARAGLRVLPDADFAAPLAADLLLVPGGVVNRAMACPDTLAWVQRMHAASRVTASVCTGAFILAAAGVLTDEPVTTHWEDQADLQQQFPRLRVQSGVRWVEAGVVAGAGENAPARLTTSAGISAGMDMSLRLVATMADPHMRALGLSGQALAERTALQMETTWTQQAPHPPV